MSDQETKSLRYDEELTAALRENGLIIGQKTALALSAQIVQRHLWNRPSRTLFFGPSGCGKTHIWKTMQCVMGPSLVLCCKAADLLDPDSLGHHLRTLSSDLRDHCILVIDNLEDILTDIPASRCLVQLCQGSLLNFPSRNRRELSFEADSSTMSLVFLGCFPQLQERLRTSGSPPNDQDLKMLGMYPPLAESFQDIYSMPGLNARQLALVGRNEVDRLARIWNRKITVAPQALIAIGRYAMRENLGGKWVVRYVRMVLTTIRRKDPENPTVHMEYLDPLDDPRARTVSLKDIPS